ncbi:XdhC family protein [Microbacterium sp. SD291]|uniref:XdhC family protein n=1 Tax=Microbacterium sp. SD291 TaxID=2782007 RepID=UPI001A96798C|nr:XdhC/CoxI family protein [Microbacterium sp. SD291]MBO0981856.1 XdhC family protein [Microbacterium sp. SD291]
MLDRSPEYAECFAEPQRWAIATIVEVSGSVPRPAGTSMAVRDDGRTIGSVSGGCVEGAVVDAALGSLETGAVELHSFGYADDDGISIGLMCGGDVRVLVQPVRTMPAAARGVEKAPSATISDAHMTPHPSSDAYSTSHGHGEHAAAPATRHLVRDLPLSDASAGSVFAASPAPLRSDALCAAFDDAEPPAEVVLAAGHAADRVRAALAAGGTHVFDITDRSLPECPVVRRLLVESTAEPARLVIYGANDFSAALAQAAAALGRHVTVCDARPVFATRSRHPGAHEVVLAHPAKHFAQELDAGRIDARTAVVVLTHDPRFDLPVLDRALRAGLAYVGAMGSRVTHEKRMQELRAGGLSEGHLTRLHSPIGLDLGARTPAEVAVSILAELILVESTARASAGRTRQPHRMLRDTAGDVHDARRVCAPEPAAVPASASVRASAPAPVKEAVAWM